MKTFGTFLFVTLVCIELLHSAKCDEAENIGKIAKGFESGKKLLKNIKESKFVDTVSKTTKWGLPLLQAVGSFAKVLSLEMEGESKELKFMKAEFKKINEKMDTLDQDFLDVKRLIDWNAIKIGYGEYERSINVMQDKLMEVVGSPLDVVPVTKDIFIMLYEQDFNDATRKLYEGIINGNMIFSENLVVAIRKYTDNHQKKVQKFLLGLIQLLMKGIEIDTAYLSFKDMNSDLTFWSDIWEKRLTDLENVFLKVNNEIEGNWYKQAEEDIETFSAKNHGLTNQDYNLKLYRFLTDKFPHRAWFTLVYNPLAGDTPHYVFVCAGFIRFRQRGKNVVVGSAPIERRTFNANSAVSLLKSLPRNILSWGSGPAQTVLNYILTRTGRSCGTYSMAAVVEWGGGVWYASDPTRRGYDKWEGSYNRFINVRKDFNLLLFG